MARGRMWKKVDNFLVSTMGWMPARVGLAVLSWFGMFNLYMVRINLSVTIVAMVTRNKTTGLTAPCLPHFNTSINRDEDAINSSKSDTLVDTTLATEDDMDWDETTQGFVLASFFYGYCLTQVIGGRLAEMYGARGVYGTCILAGGVSAVLTPLAARTHYGALIALRAIQGLFQGVSWPSMHACISRWIPPVERPRFIGIVYFATALSASITMIICGLVIDAFGWDAAFYVTGSLSLAWCVFWFAFMHNTPSEHPRISAKELEYIEKALEESGTSSGPQRHTPWRQMLTSMPLWAIIVCDVGNSWGISLFYAQLPTYMKNIQGFSIKENGALSGLPFLARYAGTIVWSCIASHLLKKEYLSIIATRRIFSILALWGPGIMVLGVSFAGCNSLMVLILICVGLFFNGGNSASFLVNSTDIAPNFSGTLMGIFNTLSSIIAFIVPVVVGVMTDGHQTLAQWQKVFWTCVPMYVVAEIFYLIFCSGSVQPWNFIQTESRDRESGLEKEKEEEEEEEGEKVGLSQQPPTTIPTQQDSLAEKQQKQS